MKENELLENKAMREKLKDRIQVLNKVKALLLLPNTEFATTEQVATYYEVGQKAISSLVFDNREEIEEDGYKVFKGKEISQSHVIPFIKFKSNRANYKFIFEDGTELSVGGKGISLFTKRAILRVGMLLRDSKIAKQIREEIYDKSPELYYELNNFDKHIIKKYEVELEYLLDNILGTYNKIEKQVSCGTYKIDFVINDYLAIECDEDGHSSYDIDEEKFREKYIQNNGYIILRYDTRKNNMLHFIGEVINVLNNEATLYNIKL